MRGRPPVPERGAGNGVSIFKSLLSNRSEVNAFIRRASADVTFFGL